MFSNYEIEIKYSFSYLLVHYNKSQSKLKFLPGVFAEKQQLI